jgi:hypothetical protein
MSAEFRAITQKSMAEVGYTWLLARHGVKHARLHHASYLGGVTRTVNADALGVDEYFPAKYAPPETEFDQLVFALKYDGIDLVALTQIFAHLDRAQLTARIAAQPRSKYARRIWFLYEGLTQTRLELPDATGGYTPVLEPEQYFCAAGRNVARQRVIDNLLGELGGFCPIVRRTPALEQLGSRDLGRRAREITETLDPTLLARAVNYLHTKETRSSFAIEREEPGTAEQRFIEQLARVADLDLDSEAGLTAAQHAIVDPRYRDPGFRKSGDLEVYVSETIGFDREHIHHVGARSQSTPALMAAWARMRPVEGPAGPVVEAACRAFAFVFIHPFGDGNGRVHRLLFHHVLARRGYLPTNLIVPISSAILADLDGYDRALEQFSRRVLPMVDHQLDERGLLTVSNDPDDHYRYPDLSAQAEATFRWLERGIEHDLVRELEFLRRHDQARAQMRRVLDMPARKAKLFLVLCLSNRGKLSKRKHSKEFPELSDELVTRLEDVVNEAFEGYDGPLE